MKIGPVDIRNHVFQKKMRGVDEGEVRAYLDLAADRLEEEILAADELRGRIDRVERQLDEYRRLEKTLRDSLVAAERIADDRAAQAETEARLVRKNAELEAEKIVMRAREQVARFRAELDDLRRQRVTYVERFRALLRSQEKILEAGVTDFEADLEDVRAEAVETARAIRESSPAVAAPPTRRPEAAPAPVVPSAVPPAEPIVAEPAVPEPVAQARPAEDDRPPSGIFEQYLGEEGLFSPIRQGALSRDPHGHPSSEGTEGRPDLESR